ncbi:MAG TPA: hypothetical protein VF763_01575 [Candidatus Limnocylindrales bacterium]
MTSSGAWERPSAAPPAAATAGCFVLSLVGVGLLGAAGPALADGDRDPNVLVVVAAAFAFGLTGAAAWSGGRRARRAALSVALVGVVLFTVAAAAVPGLSIEDPSDLSPRAQDALLALALAIAAASLAVAGDRPPASAGEPSSASEPSSVGAPSSADEPGAAARLSRQPR